MKWKMSKSRRKRKVNMKTEKIMVWTEERGGVGEVGIDLLKQTGQG